HYTLTSCGWGGDGTWVGEWYLLWPGVVAPVWGVCVCVCVCVWYLLWPGVVAPVGGCGGVCVCVCVCVGVRGGGGVWGGGQTERQRDRETQVNMLMVDKTPVRSACQRD